MRRVIAALAQAVAFTVVLGGCASAPEPVAVQRSAIDALAVLVNERPERVRAIVVLLADAIDEVRREREGTDR